MTDRILGPRDLNRALLARQLLLERSPVPITEAVEAVGGLQTQYAPSGYVGLWTRVAGFERDALTHALEDRSIVQATLLRTTIHMVSRAEFWRYAAGLREARTAGSSSIRTRNWVAATSTRSRTSGRHSKRSTADRPGTLRAMDALRRAARAAMGFASPERAGPEGGGSAPGVPVGRTTADRQARDRAPFVLLLLAALLVLWVARGVLGPFIVAAVVAYAFSPLVSAGIRRTGWPRIAIVGVGYVVAAIVIAVIVLLLAGRIAHEIGLLTSGGPDALATTLRQLLGTDRIEFGGQTILVADIAKEIQLRAVGLFAEPGDAIHVAASVGEIGLQLILTVIVTFYFLVDGEAMMDKLVALLPIEHRTRTVDVLGRIHDILGKWLRGQILLIALVSAVAYIGLGPVLHLPYALLLALMTGVLEIIPLVGPIFATAIVAVDAFARGGAGVAAAVIVFYFVLRQVEDQVVMPVVIGRAVHLHPVVTIFAVLVGLSLYGVLGGLLGVPIAAAANVVFRELYPTEPVPVAAIAPAPPPSTSEASS